MSVGVVILSGEKVGHSDQLHQLLTQSRQIQNFCEFFPNLTNLTRSCHRAPGVEIWIGRDHVIVRQWVNNVIQQINSAVLSNLIYLDKKKLQNVITNSLTGIYMKYWDTDFYVKNNFFYQISYIKLQCTYE